MSALASLTKLSFCGRRTASGMLSAWHAHAHVLYAGVSSPVANGPAVMGTRRGVSATVSRHEATVSSSSADEQEPPQKDIKIVVPRLPNRLRNFKLYRKDGGKADAKSLQKSSPKLSKLVNKPKESSGIAPSRKTLRNKRLGGPYAPRTVDSRHARKEYKPYRLRGVLFPPPQLSPERLVAEAQRERVTYAYFVERSRYGQLPVYIDVRNGRSRVLTILRKLEGNVQALRNDLARDLFPNGKADQVVVRRVSNQIVIKGRHAMPLKRWLHAKGF